MSNIFWLAYINKDEDYFTACLQYVIDNMPTLGQKIVDYLMLQAEQETSEFIEAIDHPKLDRFNRPDLLLRRKDFDIICEHKLESRLGDIQLERYVKLATTQPKKTYLVLISNSSHSVKQSVLNSPIYLYPHNTLLHYFRWQDIYPLVTRYSERLIREFAEFMQDLGMQPPEVIQGWEDIFDNPATAEKFGQCWEKVCSFFKNETKAICKRTNNGLAFEIRKPSDWLHLIYLSLPTSGYSRLSPSSPSLVAWIWFLEDSPYINAYRSIEYATLTNFHNSIEVFGSEPREAGWKIKGNAQPMLVAKYRLPLEKILDDNLQKVALNLYEFVTIVYNHVQEVIHEFAETNESLLKD